VLPTEIIVTSFLAIALAAFIISQRTRTPYTLVLVLTGIALAAFSLSTVTGVDTIYNQLVGGGLFVGVVLPPLLFESMMDVSAAEFRSVARAALSLATVGVVLATLVTGLFLWKVAGISFYPAFLYAALISPTDTATVLEVFKRVKVPARLATMMETEAAFNDATGITLFAAILTSMNTSGLSLLSVTGEFVWTFGGGILMGLGVAVAASLLLRLFDDPIAESVLTLVAVYGAYSVSTVVGVSGIVAVSTAGISYGIIWAADAPRVHRETLRSFWSILAFLANSVAFLTIGLATNLSEMVGFLVPIAIGFGAVLGARFISVYSILRFVKVGRERVPNSWKAVASLGGIRGAVSIVLAASLPASLEGGDLIRTVVLGVAFISIVFQGQLLSRYAKSRFTPSRTKQ
jgi:CPA1 family monovalent cation:H+ antiporter